MYDLLHVYLKQPPVYTKTSVAFWDDEHISAQMLKAHLDPEFDGASRKLAFINRSVEWIRTILPPTHYPALLDIGCGPGIYAEKFAESGYRVTGVDLSSRSIDYARASAAEKGLPIRYIQQNYLSLHLDETFDLVTMIYCDYGALSTEERNVLMQTVYKHLKPGGVFLLDAFSLASYETFTESQTWEQRESGGFWSPKPYFALHGAYRYPNRVTLRQSCIITDCGMTNYYLWDTYFSAELLAKEAADAGFQLCGQYGDVAGAAYNESSPTLAVVLKK